MSSIHCRGSALNRNYFAMIFTIFAIPLVAATTAYYFSNEMGIKSKNFGVLLTPPVPLRLLELRESEGKILAKDTISGRWVLVYYSDSPCAVQCGKDLMALEKIRMALGKDYRKTGMLLLTLNNHRKGSGSERLPFAIPVLLMDEQDKKKLAAAAGGIGFYSGPLLFLADIHGNLMMTYGGEIDQQAIYDDLRRLLKVNKRVF